MFAHLVQSKRGRVHLSVLGIVLSVAVLAATAGHVPYLAAIGIAMGLLVVGAGLWLPLRLVLPVAALAWLLLQIPRVMADGGPLATPAAGATLLAMACATAFAVLTRRNLDGLEEENVLLGTSHGEIAGFNPQTGIFYANQLRPTLRAELARSRRFNRKFALVLAGIREMRQRFDYRDEAVWKASVAATTELLRQTRHNVDRVYHYKEGGFAVVLPEADGKDVVGLISRLRRLARSMEPAEGEPGGPLPLHFGATFFPECATSVDDLIRRAEIALRIAAEATTRYHLDSAAAPALPAPETLRSQASSLPAPVAVSPDLGADSMAGPLLDVQLATEVEPEPFGEFQDLELLAGRVRETLALIRAAGRNTV